MKKAIFALAAVGLVGAQPHRHAHQHLRLARQDATVTHLVSVPGPTVVTYELNGQTISDAEFEEGIANGTLVLEGGSAVQSASSDTQAAATVSVASELESASATANNHEQSSATAASASSSAASSYSSQSPSSGFSSGPSSNYTSGSSTGLTADFPSGEIDCSEFPSDYGALVIEYMALGGWIGIQTPGGEDSDGYYSIETAKSGSCSNGNCCTEGAYCSYACPIGYQKSQWPSTQGSTGQSVGGLYCQNGKLHLTNTAESSLCIQGTSEVNIMVENNLGESVAVCRTDYPGTEAETVPLAVAAGQTKDMTCPNEETYYQWLGKPTSAQYYVNQPGSSPEDACLWGSSNNPTGNYAPLNLGVGYSAGRAWLSIMQNMPTTKAQLSFKVTIESEDPDNYPLSGSCCYENGVYSGSDGESYSGDTGAGCTVSIAQGGAAKFVFTSN